MKKKASEIKEDYVKKRVREILKKYASYWHMPVQTGYGSPALDFNCCCGGRFLGIETKRPGKHLTPRQEFTKSEIEEAQGHVIVVGEEYFPDEDMFSGEAELIAWLLLKPSS